MSNILKRADEIVNARSEEQSRGYGDFETSMKWAADIFNSMTGMSVTSREMHLSVIAIKLARERHRHKEDNLLDVVAYLGALNDAEENRIEKERKLKQLLKIRRLARKSRR